MSNLSDPIADFLTRIRNARQKSELLIPYSKMKSELARILKQEGYITDYELDTTGPFPQIKVTNKLVNRTSVIVGIKRISKPGLRKYVGASEIPRVLGGMGVSILSTPRGVITGREAKKQNVGGELLAYVW
ncbi:MAG: rpsH [Chthoniobacteraceae bacterium]|nr:rpsH [Chthoniobacteraceae bacterium]MDB6170956.1 rpsH [Chthoniobacteraceae bacterium]